MNRLFKILLFALLVTLSATAKTTYQYPFAPSTGLLNDVEKGSRNELCLNGYWQFQPVATPKDYKQGKGIAPELPMPTTDGWSKTPIKIPSPWNINDFANRNLEGPDHRNYPSYPKEWEKVLMGWMKKTVKVPADWSGEEIRLYFEAVAGQTVVYVNGHEVGQNFDLFLPFSFNVTPYVTPGQDAEILVGVRSQKLFEDNSTIGRRIVPAGSMWGTYVNGIWQDVYLLALPKVRVEDVYVKPLVDKNTLELEVELINNTDRKCDYILTGDVRKWINKAGTDVNSAPVPAGELGATALTVPATKVSIPAGATKKVNISIPVNGALEYWTPEHPNLYGLTLDLKNKKQTVDVKYDRFGWRQWTFKGTELCLNGQPYQLHGDAWHFQGIPQLTRRYAWAWYKAIKDMNGNAVRPHAQVYPRFYLDLADEMGICVLGETANWASDGGPKLDSPKFWEASKDHLARFVKRDRNHASLYGWSISNENKPVILNVFNRPDLMPQQKQAWEEWRDMVVELDPTRQWISSDGEDDGDGILPVTVGHYGDKNSMKNWKSIGKPWGVGEHSMAYYGTPQQTAKYNGERSYESQEGRMEGLANEVYNLIKDQREMGASYTSVFNMVWYALQPLPLGKKDLNTTPDLNEDGIFFGDYVEGVPGVQPERVGPYCTTLNPGYDPSLPLYREWPMFTALRAANAPGAPAWCEWAEIDKSRYDAPAAVPAAKYEAVAFIGPADGNVKAIFDEQGVSFSSKVKNPAKALYIVDATKALSDADKKEAAMAMSKGADVWFWGISPAGLASISDLLPREVKLTDVKRSSFIPVQKSWIRGLNNSDFYFCQLQTADVVKNTLGGALVDEGEVLLNACKTDWRHWNMRAEEIKTAGTLRSENEAPADLAVMVKYPTANGDIYLSTLGEFVNSEKGFNTLGTILTNAGVDVVKRVINPNDVFFVRDGLLTFPASLKEHLVKDGDKVTFTFYTYSPRALDDLLIEPDMPKLSLKIKGKNVKLAIGGKDQKPVWSNHNETQFNELPLLQGWNELTVTFAPESVNDFNGSFRCDNKAEFVHMMKAAYTNPDKK